MIGPNLKLGLRGYKTFFIPIEKLEFTQVWKTSLKKLNTIFRGVSKDEKQQFKFQAYQNALACP